MLKKGWQKLIGLLDTHSIKVAARRLDKPDRQKYGALVKRQEALLRQFKQVLHGYENKLADISKLLERSRKGEVQGLAWRISQLQEEISASLERAELSISETRFLHQELADRRRLSEARNQGQDDMRSLWLKNELVARGFVLPEGSLESDVEPRSPMEQLAASEGGDGGSYAADSADIALGLEEDGDDDRAYLALADEEQPIMSVPDAESIIGRIQELSRELTRQQNSLEPDAQETLRLAGEIRQLHAFLRKADRSQGIKRDRVTELGVNSL